MEEEQLQQQTESVGTSTELIEKVEQEKKLDDFPRLEDLMKSEKEIKPSPEIEGVSQVEQKTQTKDRIFTRKSDEKKVYIKKRLKILTTVYISVVVLMLAFVITNIATLAILNKNITTNTDTIQTEQTQVLIEESKAPTETEHSEIQISLNEPRDYSEDKKELTWLDKITILFRNLFG